MVRTYRLMVALVVGAAMGVSISTRAADPQPQGVPPAGSQSGEASAHGVSVLSGGVGQDAQEAMRRAAADYNVHLLFATRQGAYLANVAYSISDQQGKQLAAGTSDGPWLYVKLPPGRYQLTAESNGMRQSRDVTVVAGKPVRLDFRFAD